MRYYTVFTIVFAETEAWRAERKLRNASVTGASSSRRQREHIDRALINIKLNAASELKGDRLAG
jgi:hypothetical protein